MFSRFLRIAVVDLDVKSLARTMLAKSTRNAAQGQTISFTAYKAANAGRCVAKTLKDRVHQCPGFRAVEDLDVNAAMIIRKRVQRIWCA